MKLISHETVFYDYTDGTEDSIQNVVAEEKGRGALPRLIERSRCSLFDCVRVVADEEGLVGNRLSSMAAAVIRNKKITECYAFLKHDKIYLQKTRKGVSSGRKENVFSENNGK